MASHNQPKGMIILTGLILVTLADGCQPAPPPTATPTIVPTPTLQIVTLPPEPTVAPTWTPVPPTETAVPPPTDVPTETPIVPTTGPQPTESPACNVWRGQRVTNQEEFEAESPIIQWPVMAEANAYIIDVYNPNGTRVINQFVDQPTAAEPTPAEDEAATPVVRYEVDVEKLGGEGFGFGWEVVPVNDAGVMCNGISGEFSYTAEAQP